MRIISVLNRKLEEYLLVATIIVLVALVSLQVFFRFVVNFSFGWSEELARYLLIWVAWISASYAVQHNAHIRVEILKDRFSGVVKKSIEVLVLVISLGFSIFLAVEGTKFISLIKITSQGSPSLGIPMWIVYLAVPIGGTLMAIRFIQQIYYIFKQTPNDVQQEKITEDF